MGIDDQDRSKFIWVVIPSTIPAREVELTERGIHEIKEKIIHQATQLSAEQLKTSLEQFFSTVEDMLSGMTRFSSGYTLEEVEICAEISAQGTIQLVGGVTAGAKGGITLKFKRPT